MNDRKTLTTAGIHPWTVNTDLIQESIIQETTLLNTIPEIIIPETISKTINEIKNDPMDIEPNESIKTMGYLGKCDACGNWSALCITEECIYCEELFDLCADCYSSCYTFCPSGYGCNKNAHSLNYY